MDKQRLYYMDNLKVMLTCLVVAHHAGQAYGPTGGVWVVKDADSIPWLGHFFAVNASFMMGLYFFISGYFLVASLDKKTANRVLNDRLKRLGLPLLFFIFLVFLPFNYFLSGGDGNIFLFLANTYLQHPPLATGHLWFVASLLVYTFLYLGLRSVLRTFQVRRFFFRPYFIIVYVILLGLLTGIARSIYPIDQWRTWLVPLEPAHLPQYFSLFLLGTLFRQYNWLGNLKSWYGIVLLIITALISKWPSANMPHAVWAAAFGESGLCVGLSIVLLVSFRKFVNQGSATLNLLSQHSYGIYLFHLLIVIALQQYISKWPAAVEVKFALVTVSGVLLSLLLSALLRRSAVLKRII